jgi:hypothetical protein
VIYLEKIQIPEMGYIPVPETPLWARTNTQDEYYPVGVFGDPQSIYEMDCK